MKKGIRIINCARGELIVEQALADAIKSGHVAGAALDVFHQEPLKESPFFNLENVILSPHIAGATDEAQEAIARHYYRPIEPAVLQRHADTLRDIKLFSITAVAKDWDDAFAKFFGEGKVFDSIYRP